MVDEYTKIAYMKAEASKTPDRRPSPLILPRSAKNLTNLTLLPVITDEIQIDPLGKVSRLFSVFEKPGAFYIYL